MKIMDVQIRGKLSLCVAVHGQTRRGSKLPELHTSLDLQVRGEPGVAQGDEHAEAGVADTVYDEEHHEGQQ